MKRYVWSTIDAARRLIPYYILEVSDRVAAELKNRKARDQLWWYLAKKLEKHGFPPYFDEYGRRNLFWYNNVLEEYEEALERLMEEWAKRLSDYYDDEEDALWEEAEMRAREELEELPVIRLR